jgi:copper transport protein
MRQMTRRTIWALGGILIGCVLALGWVVPAQAHALPVSYDPAPNALLHTPPTQVRITFSEQINPDISRIVVVNPSNQQVDNGDVQVSANGLTMTVSLPPLPAGTYVVAWRTHSADDGHIAGGSYIFHITRADGTVPPLTGPLPSGNIIGGGGGSATTLDGPTLLLTIAQWVGIVALTLLLGIVFWWCVILPGQKATPSIAFAAAGELALEVIIGATIIEVAFQAVTLDGTARGLVSWPLISDILFHSRQGTFFLLRMGLALLGLVCLWVPGVRTSLTQRNQRRVLPIFAVGLALAFVYSGHGGAGQQWWAAPNDLLHLLANGVWLGGLFVLAALVVPALARQSAADRERYLAVALPAFSLAALVAVLILSISGPVNATVRMTSFAQLWTTAYGVVLLVKIALFIAMIAISYIHAFRLRPQLAAQMGLAAAPTPATTPNTPLDWLRRQWLALVHTPTPQADGTIALAPATAETTTSLPERLGRQIHTMIRAEAALGLGVLLCAMLLGPLAGTLAVIPASDASFGATGGNQTYSGKADSLPVTLSITPGKFGTNTVTVVVKNPDGTPATGSTIFILSEMVEMDMGINNFDLHASGQPGTYTGTVDLPMAGHWRLTTVIRTTADPQHLHRTTFTVSASY